MAIPAGDRGGSGLSLYLSSDPPTCPQVSDTAIPLELELLEWGGLSGPGRGADNPSVCHGLIHKALHLFCDPRTRWQRTYPSGLETGAFPRWELHFSAFPFGQVVPPQACPAGADLSMELPLGLHRIPAFASSSCKVSAGLLDQRGQCPCSGLPWVGARRESSKAFLSGQGSDPLARVSSYPNPDSQSFLTAVCLTLV